MSPFWRILYLIFVVEGSLDHMKEAMRRFVLHESNPPCHNVDTNRKLTPCTVSNHKDYQRLMAINSNRSPPQDQMKLNCRDGSNNMTCLPLSMKPVRYFCACDTVKADLNTGIEWSDEWEEITESGLVIKRSLCHTQADWCEGGTFRKNLVYLVKHYAPLDSQITVSSVLGSAHTKEKVRLEYNGDYCAWIKANDDVSPWIKFDFLQSRVAVGVKIGQRCDDLYGPEYVTSFHLSTSDDDVTWSYEGTNVQAVYEDLIFTWWFNEMSARYWRIEPVTFFSHASMQADLIGYV